MTTISNITKKSLRWVFGIFLLIFSIGGFASGNFIFAIIILLISILITPYTSNCVFKLFSGESSLSNLRFLPNESNKFIKSLDFNDENIIQSIENHFLSTKKPISDKRKSNIGKKIIFNNLKFFLSDLHLSKKEKLRLQEITEYFNLSKKEISDIKRKLNKKSIERLVTKSYNDKILTDEEQEEIVSLAEYLELSKDNIEKIKKKVALSLLKVAFNDKLSDKRITPTEESELTKLLRDLKISKEQLSEIVPKKSLKQFAYAKLLWSLDNGVFYPIPNPSITLRKKEECYLSFPAKLLEYKTIHKGYSYSSSSISIPITKGVRYRTGGGRAKPIKEQVKIKHIGSLFLTNLRIVFSTSGNKSFQIPFTKLISFNVYRDGLEFILERRSHLIYLSSKNVEMFSVGLTSSIRNFLNSDNEILKNALSEIEENDNFIDV